MKIAHIMPKSLTHLATGRSVALCLAQFVLADEEYAAAYRAYASKDSNWLIMDNGLAEDGKPLNPDMLLQAATKVQPQEIVLPDYTDPVKNIQAVEATMQHEAFVSFVNDHCTSLMYVPHGDTLWQWFDNLRVVIRFERMPDSIGISKFHSLVHPQAAVYGRGPLGILARGLFPDKPLHYLGLSLPPIELKFMPYARSCDTCVASMYGLYGLRLSEHGTLVRPNHVQFDFDATFDNVQLRATQHNIMVMETLAARSLREEPVWLNG